MNSRCQSRHGGKILHIQFNDGGMTTNRLDRIIGFFERTHGTAGDYQFGTCRRRRDSDSAPDTTAGTGNQNNLVG